MPVVQSTKPSQGAREHPAKEEEEEEGLAEQENLLCRQMTYPEQASMEQVQRRSSLGSFAKKPNEDKLAKRRYIAKEIIDTERTYVQNLSWIVEVTETAQKMSSL